MNSTTAGTAKTWRKTNVPNLYVHRSGGYYYRVTLGGKQLWESLRTKLKSVAKALATDKHRSVKASKKTLMALQTGKLTAESAQPIVVDAQFITKQRNLIPNGKAAVGRSFFAVHVVPALKDRRLPHRGADTDNENLTLLLFHADSEF